MSASLSHIVAKHSRNSFEKKEVIKAITNQPLASALVAGLCVQIFALMFVPWSSYSRYQIVIQIFIFLLLGSFVFNVFRFYSYLEKFPVDRVRHILEREIRQGGQASKTYRYFTIIALRRTSALLGEKVNSKTYWSTFSFDRCLAFSLIYPLSAALFAWAIRKESVGSLAGMLALPATPSPWLKVLLVVALAFPMVIIFRRKEITKTDDTFEMTGTESQNNFTRLSDQEAERAAISFLLLIAFGGFTLVYSSIFQLFFSGNPNLVSLIIVLQALSLLLFVPKNLKFGIGASLFSAVCLYSLIASGFDLREDGSPLSAPYVFSALVTFMAAYSYGYIAKASKLSRYFICFLCAFPLFSGLSFFLNYLYVPTEGKEFSFAIVFLFPILSMINAFFDWISIGITRYLVTMGLRYRGIWPLIFGVIDVAFGFFILVDLSITLIILAQVMSTSVSANDRDLIFYLRSVIGETQSGASKNGVENFWAYFIVFSTLIPSLLNFVFGTFSVLHSFRIFKFNGKNLDVFRNGEMDISGILSIFKISLTFSILLAISTALFVAFSLVVFNFIIPGYGSALSEIVSTMAF